MVRSFAALQAEDPGFATSGVLAFSVSVNGSPNADPSRRSQFFTDLTGRLAAMPGVAAASAINHLPLEGDLWTRGFNIEGRPVAAPGEGPGAVYRASLPGYFDVMRLRVVRGRDFTWQDTASAPGVVILSENLARRHWPGEDAIGKRLVIGSPLTADAEWRTVIGIVADAANESWEGGRGDEMYLPYLQARDYAGLDAPPFMYLTFVVRAQNGEPSALAPRARAVVAGVDRDAAFSDVMTMDDAAARALARPRFQRTLLSLCALVALLLAAAGIHGVVNYGVTRRGREIGLRMALGAQRAEVGWLVVRQSLRHVLVGLAAGWVGTLVLARLMTGLLHGVTPGDPATLIGATAVLLVVAVAASALPAWRASRVAPVVAMRE
jgi:predicted permease